MSIENIRNKRPHYSSLYLSIYRPQTVFTAQVNSVSVGRGSMSIPYDNASLSGTFNVVDLQCLVGSTPGADDVGRIRTRYALSGTLQVAENSHIQWANDLYLTVVDYVTPEAIFPRIIQNPSDAEQTIFYKDYDEAYTNQNSIYGAYPCMGSHRAAILGDSGTVDLWWSASGTSHVAGSNMTYAWEFGGVVTGSTSTSHTPGMRTYNTPGHYRTKLTVTGANGSSDFAYRYVSIYSQQSANLIRDWYMTSLHGSRDEGGYVGELGIRQALPYEIRGGDLLVVFGEDWFGNDKEFNPINEIDSDGIFLVGYVLKDGATFDYANSEWLISFGSISEVMKQEENFVISVEDKLTPTTWFEALGLKGSRALYHYLKWHSTILTTSDFRYTAKDYLTQFFDTTKQSLFDSVKGYLESTYVGRLVSDRKSRLWAESDPEAYSTPTESYPTSAVLTDDDFIGNPSIEKQAYNATALVERGGIEYPGPKYENSIPLLSRAPGAAPSYSGKTDSKQGLALDGQTTLNVISGNLYAKSNSRVKAINNFQWAGNYRVDIAPCTFVRGMFDDRMTSINQKVSGTFLVDSVDWAINHEKGSTLPTSRLSLVVNGTPGETEAVQSSETVNPTFNFQPPAIPPFKPLLPTPLGDDIIVLISIRQNGVYYTDTWDLPTGTVWYTMNGMDMTTTSQKDIRRMSVNSNGLVVTVNFDGTELRSGYIGEPLQTILLGSDLTSSYTSPPENARIIDFAFSYDDPNKLILVAGISFFGPVNIWELDLGSFSATKKVQLTYPPFFNPSDPGVMPVGISYSNGHYVLTTMTGAGERTRVVWISPDLSTQLYVSPVDYGNAEGINGSHQFAANTGRLYNRYYGSTNGGVSFYDLGDANSVIPNGIDCDFTGRLVLKMAKDPSTSGPQKSYDYGNTWTSISGSFPPPVADRLFDGVVEYAGIDDDWVMTVRGNFLAGLMAEVWDVQFPGPIFTTKTGNLRVVCDNDYFQPWELKVYR